jgi:hypothetical protein
MRNSKDVVCRSLCNSGGHENDVDRWERWVGLAAARFYKRFSTFLIGLAVSKFTVRKGLGFVRNTCFTGMLLEIR